MARIRLSKTSIVVLILAFVVLVGSSTGYILWRVNQDRKLSEEQAAAAGCDVDCPAGFNGNASACYCGTEGWQVPGECCPGACAGQTECGGGSCDGGSNPYGPGCYSGSCQDRHCAACPNDSKCVGQPPEPPGGTSCSCESYAGCGVNCTFSGIDCQGQANSKGVAQIAMCYDTSSPSCDDYVEGHICWGKTEICKNPVWNPEGPPRFVCWDPCTTEGEICDDGTKCSDGKCRNPSCPDNDNCVCDGPSNLCEEGDLVRPVAGKQYKAGQSITIEGWAWDPDGVQNFKINFDGSRITPAVDLRANCGGNPASSCGGHADATWWRYNWTIPSSASVGTHTFAVSWEDGEGKTGSSCQDNVSITITEDIIKIKRKCGDDCASGGEVCTIDNTECTNVSGTLYCVEPTDYDCVLDGSISRSEYIALNCSCPLPPNPDWAIVKKATLICYEEDTPDPYARVNYTVSVTYDDNGSGNKGYLDEVVDTPSASNAKRIQTGWIVSGSIIPPFGVSNSDGGYLRDITWDLRTQSEWAEFDPEETKQFRYSIDIDVEDFGIYRNVVIARVKDDGTIQATEDIMVSCGDTPPTGIFDSVISRIGLGVFLVVLAIVYVNYDVTIGNGVLRIYRNGVSTIYQNGIVKAFNETDHLVSSRWHKSRIGSALVSRSRKKFEKRYKRGGK